MKQSKIIAIAVEAYNIAKSVQVPPNYQVAAFQAILSRLLNE